MFYERIVSKKAQKFPSLAPSALARHFLHLLAMRRAQKGLFATAFFRRHVRLDCTTAALQAFQEYLLANYTPGKELFSSLAPLALTMHFLTFLAGGNAQNTTIHQPVRLTMFSFWVLYDLSSGFLGMILMHFIIKKHISSLEPSALARHFVTRYTCSFMQGTVICCLK